ncbi:MAG: hypothetical protein MZV70_12740 [Desulfobacterales bacterium]|nr:hypothetical protein [Desulfobacterales bacterium]
MKEIDAEDRADQELRASPPRRSTKRGEMTVWERIEYLVDPGTFCPLHTIYDPRQRGIGQHGRRRRPGADQRQVVRADRLQQQVDRRRLDRRAGGQQPAGDGHGQDACTCRWCGW